MALSLTTDQRNALEAGRLKARHAVKFELDSGTVGFWDDLGSITVDSVTYTGVGNLGTIEPVVQHGDLVASGLELVLSGLDQSNGADAGAIFADFDDEEFHGRAVTLYRWYFEPDSNAADAARLVLSAQLFKGFLDRIKRSEVAVVRGNGETTMSAAITAYCESRALEFSRRHTRFRTNEDQQSIFAGDKFFEYVPTLATREIFWGRNPQSYNGPTGPGGPGPRGNGGGEGLRNIV